MKTGHAFSVAGLLLAVSMVLGAVCNTAPARAMDVGSFNDLEPTAWYMPAVTYVSGLDWMVGDNLSRFDPDREITRAEFATTCARVLGGYVEADISMYTDVREDDWYHGYMAKGVQLGIVEGVSETRLDPRGLITREQAMTILARALALPAGDMDDLERFLDKEDISEWAVPYVAAMVKDGRAQGYLDGTMGPKRNITRSETAKLLLNCIPNVVGDDVRDARFKDNVLYMGNGNTAITTEYRMKGSQFEDMLLLAAGMGDGQLYIHDSDIARLVCWGCHDVWIYPGCRIEEIQINRTDGPCIIHWLGDKDDLPYVNFGEGGDPGNDIVDEDGKPIPVVKDPETPKGEKPEVPGGTTGGSTPRPVHYPTVYFEPRNGQGRMSRRIGTDGRVAPVDEPKWDGYVFAGWYVDEEYSRKWAFSAQATDGMVFYGRWHTDDEWKEIEKLNAMVDGNSIGFSAELDLLALVGGEDLVVNLRNNSAKAAFRAELVLEDGTALCGADLEPGGSVDTLSVAGMPGYGNYGAKWVVTPKDGGKALEVGAMVYVAYMW